MLCYALLGAAAGRMSFPFFFDPSFDAQMTAVTPLLSPELRARAEQRRAGASRRWDGTDVTLFEGCYGDYLITKVSRVFPLLCGQTALTQPDERALAAATAAIPARDAC